MIHPKTDYHMAALPGRPFIVIHKMPLSVSALRILTRRGQYGVTASIDFLHSFRNIMPEMR